MGRMLAAQKEYDALLGGDMQRHGGERLCLRNDGLGRIAIQEIKSH